MPTLLTPPSLQEAARIVLSKRRSLRSIAEELAALGHLGPSGQPYHAGSIRHMLAG